MTYLVTAFAASVTSLTGRWLWWTLADVVRGLYRLAAQRHIVLLAMRVLAAGGDVEWRVRGRGLDVRVSSRPAAPSGPPTAT
ncbi:hypothetical protein [Amycolatopsis sp. NPDC004169]|uniref:hypothetical protein n=1 Tax=Amycolatopsis sp. NPDC004169 TaxID=3154453 RepID=UPI0033BA256A